MRKNFTSRAIVGMLVVAGAVVISAAPLMALQTVPAPVPEISGASLSAGLGLLGAGMLWLRARRRVK